MKPLVLMFYYVNIDGMSNRRVEEILHRMYRHTKIEDEDYKIVQQYFPIRKGETRVEVVTVPQIQIADHDLAHKIHRNIEKIIGNFEQFEKVNSIDDLYDGQTYFGEE